MGNDDMVRGYFDGCDPFAISPGSNNSASYIHGWKNGRNDRTQTPRSSAADLRDDAKEAMKIDARQRDGK